MVEDHFAGQAARIDRARLVSDIRSPVSMTSKKFSIPRPLHQQVVGEIHHLLQPRHQDGGEIHESDDHANGHQIMERTRRR